MQKILVTSLAAYWTVVFALGACGIAGLSAAVHAPDMVATAMATAHALVALLFLWTAFAAWGARDDGADDVARLALGMAVLLLAAVGIHEALATDAPMPDPTSAMQLAALAATYLVIRVEEAATEREPPPVDYSSAVARRLAAGAAHGSMLSRLSRRGPEIAESDG